MRQIFIFTASLLLLMPAVLADWGHMMGYEEGYTMMGGVSGLGWFGWGFLWLIWFCFAAFLFAVIFWATYRWMVRPEKKKVKR